MNGTSQTTMIETAVITPTEMSMIAMIRLVTIIPIEMSMTNMIKLIIITRTEVFMMPMIKLATTTTTRRPSASVGTTSLRTWNKRNRTRHFSRLSEFSKLVRFLD